MPMVCWRRPRAIADKLIVAGYHDSMPCAGAFKRDGNGYVFVPVENPIFTTLIGGCLAEFGAFFRGQSAKLVPQPHEAFACGLFTLNEVPIISSTKSISDPAM